MSKLKTATRLVGFSKDRIRADFYPTPHYVTEALLKNETFEGLCWEPACGEGDISKVLIEKGGLEVYSSDLLDYGYGAAGIDFTIENNLFTGGHRRVQNVITNPPFNIALDFVYMAKRVADHKICLLLKTTFLEGVERKTMWKDKAFPFKCMYQFSRRVSFGSEKVKSNKQSSGGMMSFAWFVWDKKYEGKPYIEWI